MVDKTVDGLQMKLTATGKLCAATDCKYTAVGWLNVPLDTV